MAADRRNPVGAKSPERQERPERPKCETPPIAVGLEIHPLDGIAPDRAYAALCALGAEDDDRSRFLLESLAGPQADKKTALLGTHRLLSFSVRGSSCRLSFSSSVSSGLPSRFAAALSSLGLTPVGVAGDEGRKEGAGLAFELDSGDRLWQVLRRFEGQFTAPADSGRFRFGWFGWFGYGTAHYIERLPRRIAAVEDEEPPDVLLNLFSSFIHFDLISGAAEVVTASSAFWSSPRAAELAAAIAACAARLPAADDDDDDDASVPKPRAVHDSTDKSAYCEAVGKALEHIAIGDIYQVQLGHQLSVDSSISPWRVYRRLRRRNPSPYMYLVDIDDTALVGASPEAFLKIDEGMATMRPLAGTIARGRNAEEDERQRRLLRSDPKERSEHIMLVDLCRNDIGRICTPDSLAVTELLGAEAYSHVFHLVSNVVGRLADHVDVYDAVAAAFPAGTMTGAPKIRAMEIIEELENRRRGLYAGALGLIDFSGYANLALCIRSALYRRGRYAIRASAGVVADSQPEKEWDETLAKLNGIYWAIAGETLTP